MIIFICSLLLISIFLCLAILHFYWALGGRWGAVSAAPTNAQGVRLLNTGPIPCVVIGVGLLLFASQYVLVIMSGGILPAGILRAAGWIIPIIFLVRAIGDFNYVGLTKKLKTTTFARQDTRYYTPLCLLIAVLGFSVMLLK